jgi:hypothetical protein
MPGTNPAYHTKSEEEPGQRDVHHNRYDCPDGRRIKPKNREQGTNNKPLCDACIKLIKEGDAKLSTLSTGVLRRLPDTSDG